MSLGTLVVELTANVAKFQSDLGRAEHIAQNTAQRIDAQFALVKNTLATFGVSLASFASVEAIGHKIESVIRSAGELQQLSERTGGSVETLSQLAAVAKLSGTDTDQLATGLQKLSRAMRDAEQGGAKTAATFQALGISTQGLTAQRPDEVFIRIAESLSKYQDGAGKTALAQELLGKSGANLLPVMRDLIEAGDLSIKTTTAQARAADEYEKNIIRLKLVTDEIIKALSLELVPVFNAFTKAILESLTASDGLREGAKSLAQDGSLRSWAESAAMGLAYLIDGFSTLPDLINIVAKTLYTAIEQFKALDGVLRGAAQVLSGDFTQGVATARGALGAIKTLGDGWMREMQAIWDRPLFSDRLRQQLDEARRGLGATPTLPTLPGGKDEELLRKSLEDRLKQLEREVQDEQRLLQTREQLLTRAYGDALLATQEYFAARQAASDENLAHTLGVYAQERAALVAYQASVTDAKAKLDAQNRISDIAERERSAVNAAQARSVLLTLDEAKATRAYQEEIERLNIRLLALQGNLSEAAQRQNALQDRSFRQRLIVEGNSEGLAMLDQLEKLQIARAALNELSEQSARIETQLGATEARIGAERERGTLTEIEAMAKIAIARRDAAEQLTVIADQMRAIAEASGDPRLIVNVEAFKARILQLSASADELTHRLRSIFEDNFASFFSDLVTGAKSFKAAFLDMARGIEQAITRIVAQNLAEKLFGKGGIFGGAAGGLAGFISNILGSLFGNSVGALPARASGGPVYANQAYLVGERGPEIFVPSNAGTVLPNDRLSASSGGSVVIHNHFAAGTDLRTIDQAATQIGLKVQRALRRSF